MSICNKALPPHLFLRNAVGLLCVSHPLLVLQEPSPTEPAKRHKSERSIKSDKDPEKATEESTDSVKKMKSESTKAEKKTGGEGSAPSGRGLGGEGEGMDQMEEVLVCTICQEIMHDCVR